MTTQLEDTGERMIPEFHKGKNMYGAHIGRYQAGLGVVKDKVVLDIACGSGYGTQIMAASASRVYGVDVDEPTIRYAKEHYAADNIEYLVGDGVAIPLSDHSVDVVVSYETIEHIEDYQTFMKEVKRVLKPGGVLLLSTPNDIEYGEGNHYHIHEFEYKELKSLVGQYYKYHEDYFQTLWMYSSILSKELQTTEWQNRVQTTSTIPLKPEQCIYFFLLCSDQPLQEKIEPLGVIGEHFRHRALQDENKLRHERMQHLKDMKDEAHQQKSQLQKQVAKLTEKLQALERENHFYRTSPVIKSANLVRRAGWAVRRPRTAARKLYKRLSNRDK
jgi:2-polyprenyl-3-methyl-5-hydroxy-6-metoxy-1,4-benzoquinol methylase